MPELIAVIGRNGVSPATRDNSNMVLPWIQLLRVIERIELHSNSILDANKAHAARRLAQRNGMIEVHNKREALAASRPAQQLSKEIKEVQNLRKHTTYVHAFRGLALPRESLGEIAVAGSRRLPSAFHTCASASPLRAH